MSGVQAENFEKERELKRPKRPTRYEDEPAYPSFRKLGSSRRSFLKWVGAAPMALLPVCGCKSKADSEPKLAGLPTQPVPFFQRFRVPEAGRRRAVTLNDGQVLEYTLVITAWHHEIETAIRRKEEAILKELDSYFRPEQRDILLSDGSRRAVVQMSIYDALDARLAQSTGDQASFTLEIELR